MYFVYILFSDKTLKYYTGQTDSIDKRLFRHNAGLSLSTKTGIPWKLVYKIGFTTRSEAMVL